MKRAIGYVACGLSLGALFLACSANVGADRGGLVLGISTDGTLQLDRLKVKVSTGDTVLLQNEFAVPETPLPNTLSIVSNGSSTSTATIVVTGWLAGVPVDRRDAIVTQIPSDRLVSFGIVLSARCTPFVKLGADPTTADSTCPDGQTCDPTVAQCASANVDASGLPRYVPGALPDAALGDAAPGPTSTSDAAPGPGPKPGVDGGPLPCDPAACAAKLNAITTTPASCAEAYCNAATNACAFRAHDADGDGARAAACAAPGMTIETGNDCDDNDKNVFAGQSVRCSELGDGTSVTFPGGAPVGQCSYGSKLCMADGKFAACAGTKAPTKVNCTSTADNNCDGTPDNTQCGVCTAGTTASCYTGAPASNGLGRCHAGTHTCALDASGTQTAWGPCNGEVLPAATDTCVSGNDDNCSGHANDGCACLNGQTGSCAAKLGSRGTCGGGTTTCNGTGWPGNWGGCSIGAAAHDTCNAGNDDSCNGAANEGCTCLTGNTLSCGTTGTGCTAGTQTCSGGVWPGAYGGCAGNTCGDFTVSPGVDNPCGPQCFNGTSCHWSTVACASGYHVTSCFVNNTGGHGSCTYDGPTGTSATWHGAVGGCDGTHCVLSSCTCRRDGF